MNIFNKFKTKTDPLTDTLTESNYKNYNKLPESSKIISDNHNDIIEIIDNTLREKKSSQNIEKKYEGDDNLSSKIFFKEISYEEENNKINCDFDIEYENSINQKLCEKPVYLEETGEKLGIVLDKIFDEKNNISRYKIQDCNSKSILNLEADQFDENKYGLIFRPKWYKDSLKTLEKIEFKDKISPELSTLLTDDENYNKKLFEIFIKHDKEMTNYMKDANLLNDTLNERLKIFENKRISLKDELLDLTEMRLIRDIDKKEFYDSVINYRRRLNILHLNIKKCKKLLSRLEKTSFGILNNNLVTFDNKLASNNVKKKSVKNKNVKKSKKNEDNVFKERYYRLKNEYDDLHNEYKDLRLAVEKLLILNKK